MTDETNERFELAGNPIGPDQLQFFATLGYAIARWQYIEVRLCNIAACASCARNADAFASAFHQTVGFGARLSVASTAVEHSPASAALKAEWKSLAGKLRDASVARNKIAHGLVVVDQKGQRDQLVVVKPPQNPKNRPGLASGNLGMYRPDLEGFVAKVNALIDETESFEWHLVKFLDYSDDPAIPSRFRGE